MIVLGHVLIVGQTGMKIDIAEKEETAKVDGYAITENLTLRATNSTAAS